MNSFAAISFVVASAFSFMLANLCMKVSGSAPIYLIYPAIGLAILVGVFFEIEALKAAQFGHAVMFILGLEMVFSVVVAGLIFSESYTLRDGAGFALVLAGMLLLTGEAGKIGKGEQMPEVVVRKSDRLH